MLVYCNQWTPLPVVKSCDKSFLHRCKSRSCSIFISATPSINSPSCSIIAQYLAWARLPNGSLPTWIYCSQTSPLEVTERCDMGFKSSVRLNAVPLYWCNSLSVWSKLQHNILIFSLVMVET